MNTFGKLLNLVERLREMLMSISSLIIRVEYKSNHNYKHMTINNTPRLPTKAEKRELAEYKTQACYKKPTSEDLDQQISFAETAWIAVFDHYHTDCPGYVGKVMAVVWPGAPELHEVFVWYEGRIGSVETDYYHNYLNRVILDDVEKELHSLLKEFPLICTVSEDVEVFEWALETTTPYRKRRRPR